MSSIPPLALALFAATLLLGAAGAALNFLFVLIVETLWPMLWIGAPRPSLRRKRWAFGLFVLFAALLGAFGLVLGAAAPGARICGGVALLGADPTASSLCAAPLALAVAFAAAVLALRVDPFDPFGRRRARRGEGPRTRLERRLFGVWAACAVASLLLFQSAIG